MIQLTCCALDRFSLETKASKQQKTPNGPPQRGPEGELWEGSSLSMSGVGCLMAGPAAALRPPARAAARPPSDRPPGRPAPARPPAFCPPVEPNEKAFYHPLYAGTHYNGAACRSLGVQAPPEGPDARYRWSPPLRYIIILRGAGPPSVTHSAALFF